MRLSTKTPVPVEVPVPDPISALREAAHRHNLTIDPASIATLSVAGGKLSTARVTSQGPATGRRGGQDIAFAHLSLPGTKLPEGYYRVVQVPAGTPEARLRPDLEKGILYLKAGDIGVSPNELARGPGLKDWIKFLIALLEFILLFF